MQGIKYTILLKRQIDPSNNSSAMVLLKYSYFHKEKVRRGAGPGLHLEDNGSSYKLLLE